MYSRIIDIDDQQLKISQDLSYGYAGEVWDGALVLTYFILNRSNQHSISFEDKNILELGSGTGICGLSCAIRRAKTVYLTDKEVGLADKNYQDNKSIIPSSTVIEVVPLDWTKKEEFSKIQEKFDYIICSDIIWNPKLFQGIIDVFETFTIINHTQIILAYTLRAKRDLEFFSKLKEDKEKWLIEILPESVMDEEYKADDIIILKIIKMR